MIRYQLFTEYGLWIIPLLSMFFVTDTKVYIALALIWGMIVYIVKKDLAITFFFALLLFLPFERVIRGWVFTPVPAGPEYWQEGFSYVFGMSLKLIIGIALLLLLIRDKHRHWFVKDAWISWMPLLLFLIAIAGSLTATRLELSLTGLVRFWLSLLIYLASVLFFSDVNIKKQFTPYLLSVLFMNGIIGSLQYMTQHPLGLNMEDISWNLPNGYLTSDLDKLFRVSGFMGHPTFFGSFTSMIIPMGLISTLVAFRGLRKEPMLFIFCVLSLLLGVVAIIGTLSRSAWLSIFIILIFLMWHIFSKKKIRLMQYSKYFVYISGALLVFITIFGTIFSDRIKTIQYVWLTGSGAGRLELIDHAFQMIRSHPALGVGFNHFTTEMINQGVKPEFRGFIYPVHNTFLLMFSELGIPLTTLFILFIYQVLYKSWKKARSSTHGLGVWLGTVAFLVNAQFHTLFQDPSFDLFMVMLGYLSILL